MLSFAPSSTQAHGDLHERIETITRQLEHEPRNANLYLQRADALRHHREFPAALADVATAEKLQADPPAAALQRARIWFDAEEFPQAVCAVDACLPHAVTNGDLAALRSRRDDQPLARRVLASSAVHQRLARFGRGSRID